jgi:hypothetical protein
MNIVYFEILIILTIALNYTYHHKDKDFVFPKSFCLHETSNILIDCFKHLGKTIVTQINMHVATLLIQLKSP